MPTRIFLDQIREFCYKNELSLNQLARQIGADQSIFSEISEGNQEKAVYLLAGITDHFSVSLDELLYQTPDPHPDNLGESLIPVVNVAAFASYLKNHQDEDYIHNLEYYRIPGYEHGDFRIFEVEGDSMVPTIENGDFVICQRLEGKIDRNQLYVVVSKKGIVVKRLLPLKENQPGSVVLRSDNDTYKDMLIPMADIMELWRVEGKITRQFLELTHQQSQHLERLEKDLEKVKQTLNGLIDNTR